MVVTMHILLQIGMKNVSPFTYDKSGEKLTFQSNMLKPTSVVSESSFL